MLVTFYVSVYLTKDLLRFSLNKQFPNLQFSAIPVLIVLGKANLFGHVFVLGICRGHENPKSRT